MVRASSRQPPTITQDEASLQLAAERGYLGIGGSDSHIVSHLGRCATKFERDIHDIDQLVDALQGDAFKAISLR